MILFELDYAGDTCEFKTSKRRVELSNCWIRPIGSRLVQVTRGNDKSQSCPKKQPHQQHRKMIDK